MIYKRHKYLLNVLFELAKPISFEDYQAMVSIISGESLIDEINYTFISYKDKLISLHLKNDLDMLARENLISYSDDNVISTGDKDTVIKTIRDLDFDKHMIIKNYISTFTNESTEELVESAFKSKATHVVKDKTANVALYTAGYEGDSIDSFLIRIAKSGIKRIVDVRRNPISRKFGFSKKSLALCALALQIEYTHIPELGIPSESRKSLKTKDDYMKLFDIYEKDILDDTQIEQDILINTITDIPSVLICFEEESDYHN